MGRVLTLFTPHGKVDSVRVITDKYTGQLRGFGLVEMATAEEAKRAIAALNGTAFEGRTLTVNEARPPEACHGGSHDDRGGRKGRRPSFTIL